MPCRKCGQTITAAVPQSLNRNLDLAEQLLYQAWITDISPEYRNALNQLIQAIQKLKSPNEPKGTLEEKLTLLRDFTELFTQQIPCGKCGKAWHYGVPESITTRLHLEQGHPWKALWHYVKSDLKEKWWLLSAIKDKII